MNLLLDLGNTRLKWGLFDGTDRRKIGSVAWREPVTERLAAQWAALDLPALAFGASVVDPSREALLAALVEQRLGRSLTWLRTPAAACGVRNAYAEPQRLGVDRFLGMVAARAVCAGSLMVIGAGTALTVDLLAADGAHQGGLIAPGLALMRQALLGATQQVRTDPPASASALSTRTLLPDNTADAVTRGCLEACAGLIERSVRGAAPQGGVAPRVFIGGGDAVQLQPLLDVPAELIHDAVLQGLAIWAAERSR